MAAKDKAAKAAAAAQAAKENPYLQRVIQDDELRDNMVVAFEAARNAYQRLNHGKSPAKNLIEDKKLHANLKKSADALRDASAALREAPKHQTTKKKHKGNLLKTQSRTNSLKPVFPFHQTWHRLRIFGRPQQEVDEQAHMKSLRGRAEA